MYPVLPPALNVKERNELIDRMIAKEEGAFEKLYEHNLRLVIVVIKKFNNISDKDELFSIGAIGLLKALRTYDKNKGQFVTYCIVCIQNEILYSLRKTKKFKNEISLETTIFHNPKSETDLILKDILIDPEIDLEQDYVNNNDNAINTAKVLALLPSLPKKYQEVIELYYIKGKNQKDIAEITGYSQSYCCRMLKTGIKMLREMLKISNEVKPASSVKDEQLDYNIDNIFSLKKELVVDEFHLLTNYEQQLFKMFYGIGSRKFTIEEICNQLHLSQSYIRACLKRGIERIERSKLSLKEIRKIYTLMADIKFIESMNELTINECVICCYKKGLIEGSMEAIANLLNIEKNIIDEIYQKSKNKFEIAFDTLNVNDMEESPVQLILARKTLQE